MQKCRRSKKRKKKKLCIEKIKVYLCKYRGNYLTTKLVNERQLYINVWHMKLTNKEVADNSKNPKF